ncbi:MAG: radical SAM protein [Candidatus Aminicenantes bacterium]|nr:radical SAM protein [Candidatus Aminicenantes bacterium]
MNSSGTKDIQYGDFSRQLHHKIGTKRIPVKGQMELTFSCNLKCVHCYVAKDHSKKELCLTEIFEIIDNITQEGCLWLALTGGDPFNRNDFQKIYHFAKKKGLLLTLLTNGTLISEDIANFLAEEPPFSIELTLNGVTQKTYENISRVRGSFKQAMEAIGRIMDRKLPLKIKTKATRLNVHELEKIKHFVESLGLDFNLDTVLFPRLDGSLDPCRFRLTFDEISHIEKHLHSEGECPDIESEDRFSPSDRLFRCASGISSFNISPYGDLIFCTFMRQPSFNLRKGSFREGFDSLSPNIHSWKYQTLSPCRTCEISHHCTQCPALAKLEGGEMEKPVDYYCQISQRRAAETE